MPTTVMARVTLVPVLLTLIIGTADAQSTGPKGRGGMMGDEGHMADMQMFHALLDRRADIRRRITARPDGVETLTESDVPEVARLIQEHVASMYARVEQERPIHLRDPLFREIFAHAKTIEMRTEHTLKGVRVHRDVDRSLRRDPDTGARRRRQRLHRERPR